MRNSDGAYIRFPYGVGNFPGTLDVFWPLDQFNQFLICHQLNSAEVLYDLKILLNGATQTDRFDVRFDRLEPGCDVVLSQVDVRFTCFGRAIALRGKKNEHAFWVDPALAVQQLPVAAKLIFLFSCTDLVFN